MPKLSEKTIVFISVIFAVCFLSLLWFLNQKNQTTISSLPVPVSPTIYPTVIPTKSVDPTANWKTYTYGKDGLSFSFNYPKDYSLKESLGSEYNSITLMSPVDSNASVDPDELKIVIFIYPITTKQTLVDYVETKKRETVDASIFSESNLVVAGFPAKKIVWNSSFGKSATYYFLLQDFRVEIIKYGEITTLQSDFDQILSTFKFNGNTQTVKIYYHNPKLDPNFENIVANDFKEVSIPKSSTPLKDSINELIKTFILEDEKAYGSRVTNFKLKSATIINGVAKLVFDDPESYTSGGSTRVNLIYSQIEKTALQFPSVKKVEIAGAVFQP